MYKKERIELMKKREAENPCTMGILVRGGGKPSRAAELAIASGESSARRANRDLTASASGGV